MSTNSGVKRWTMAALLALLGAALLAQGRVSLFGTLDTSAALAMLLFAVIAVVAGGYGLWSARKQRGGYRAWFYAAGCAGHLLLWSALSIAVLPPLVLVFSVWGLLLAPFCGLAVLGAWWSWRARLTDTARLVERRQSRRSARRTLVVALTLALVVIDVATRRQDRPLGSGMIDTAGTLGGPSWLGPAFGLGYWLLLGGVGLLALYWGAPPRFAPAAVTVVLGAARTVMIPLLAWPIQAHFRGAAELEGFLIALPYATNGIGSWSYFYESALDRVHEPSEPSESAA